jgi:hypothetical protein
MKRLVLAAAFILGTQSGCVVTIISAIGGALLGNYGIEGCEVFRATPAEVWPVVADALEAERFKVPEGMRSRTVPGMADARKIHVWVEEQGEHTRAMVMVEKKSNRRNKERGARMMTALRAGLPAAGVHCSMVEPVLTAPDP